MSEPIVVVENLKDWQPDYPPVRLVSARDYLSKAEFLKTRELRVINLCRSYQYLSIGYYCSLLAEPRGHRVIPSAQTLAGLRSKSVYSLNVEDLDDLVRRSLKRYPAGPGGNLELPIFFGRSEAPELQDLARQLFDLFRCPLLKVEFHFDGHWQLETVKPVPLNGFVGNRHRAFFIKALAGYLPKPWRTPRVRPVAPWDLAILHNPNEKLPPSNAGALRKFVKAAAKRGMDVELIEKKDYERLAQYDALFIRETTAIDHYTYRSFKSV